MNAPTIVLTILFAILFLLSLGYCIRHGVYGCARGCRCGDSTNGTECCCGCCKSCQGFGCQHQASEQKKEKEMH